MVWLLLIAALLIMLVMEVRVWRAVFRLIYRTGRRFAAPAKHKDV
jgi:hypothetical protein